MDLLDNLIGAMEDENKPELSETCNASFLSAVDSTSTPSRENNTLFDDARENQSWFPDEGSLNGTLDGAAEASLTFPSDSLATPVSSGDADFSNQAIQSEMRLLHNRMDELRRLSAKSSGKIAPKTANAVVVPRKKIIDSPIDFTPQSLKCDDKVPSWSEVRQKFNEALSSDEEEQHSAKTQKRISRIELPPREAHSQPVPSLTSTKPLSIVGTSDHQFYDSFFAIRVRTPKISSANFQSYLSNRQKVRLSQLHTQLKNIRWDDWVTMGVLVEKSPRKKTVNGNDYVIWKLCDLRDCQRVVKIFLFGATCIDHHLKLLAGTVLAVLNCEQMPNKANDQNDCITLKVDNAQKILEIGQSSDFAHCKSMRKNDGRRCTNVVNRSVSDVCDYHVLAETKKFASKRGEFQLASLVPPKKFAPRAGLTSLTTRAAPKNSIGLKSNSLLYQISMNKRANEVLNDVRAGLKSSTQNGPDSLAISGKKEENLPKKSEEFVSLLSIPSAGSRNLLKQIVSATTTTVTSKNQATLVTKPPIVDQDRCTVKKLTCHQFLTTHFAKNRSSLDRNGDAAKMKAVAILKRKQESSAKQGSSSATLIIGEPDNKRSKLGCIEMSQVEMHNLISSKSKHEHELLADEKDKEDSYFKVLEAKEKVDLRAGELREIPCTVVSCKECDYTWHSRSDLCKRADHKVLWHRAPRRFFKCKHCGRKAISYAKYPDKPCRKCQGTAFDRTAMRESHTNVPKLQLKVRGDEEYFL